MNVWPHGKPTNFGELFYFYHNYVKLLYSEVQTQNSLPNETLFELNAAFDHISRYWAYDETEVEAVSQAYGHLKRSCLDLFKLKVKEARNQYDTLCKIDVSVVDNGEYERNLHQLFAEIRQDATEARRLEGQSDAQNTVPAFEMWEKVYVKCERLEKEFFLHDQLKWSRKRGLRVLAQRHIVGFLIGVAASLVATLLIFVLTLIAQS